MAAIDVEAILAKLTDAEKISLLSGADFWHTKSLPNHGVPSLRLSDGPNGVRGTRFFNGVPAACFPCGTALGATWDTKLLKEVGAMMGTEAIAKGAHVLLGPTINMQRSPLGGRGFESLSEDPALAGLGAAAIVMGIQSRGVAATVKHFVCNDQEHERMAVDSQVSQRALREIYLLPFQIVVRDAQPWAFMTAYNKVNGTHVSENRAILQGILRDEWKWEGLIMSDWFGTYSCSDAVNAGLDLEMPGTSRWRGAILQHALGANKVTHKTLDKRSRAVLNLVKRCAASKIPENAEESTNNTPETSALLRKVAAESIVLMKNDNATLPLKKDKSTLIVGPNAKFAAFCGGGSASLLPYYAITPFEGISKKLTSDVTYALGCQAHKELPILGPQLKTAEGKTGHTFKVFNENHFVTDREAIDSLTIVDSNMFLADYNNSKIKSATWYAEIDGYLVAEDDGEYEFGVSVYGTAKLYVDDKLVVDNATNQVQGTTFFGSGTVEETGTISVKKGQKYHIRVDFGNGPTSRLQTEGVVVFGGGLRLGGHLKLNSEDEITRAVLMAKEVDQVIICAGLNSDWEGEGVDRSNMDLPGHMNALISAVAKANPNTTVVMQSGTPVAMPWIDEIPALIHAWYGGNETGNAIADVLFGDLNPSGKLPLTFPKRVQDNPAYLNYRCQRGRVLYGEDIYIGYRSYEALDTKPLFPFGHGLSYTTFSLTEARVVASQADDKLRVTVKVTNSGKAAGAEVVQVYIAPKNPSVPYPPKELKGFAKVYLAAGEVADVEVQVQMRYAASFWDEMESEWVMERGGYEVLVGNSSVNGAGAHEFLKGEFEVEKTDCWRGV